MPYLLRRIIETLFIIIISSVPVYILVSLNVIPSNKQTYFILFGSSAGIYYILTFKTLRAYINATHGIGYFIVTNLFILAIQAGIAYLLQKYASDSVYTCFFGFTKSLRALELTQTVASLIFWAIYIAEMIYFIINKLYYKHKMMLF